MATNNRMGAKRYNPYAIIPQIILNLTFFIIEALFVLYLLSIFKIRYLINKRISTVSVIILFLLIFFETIRRNSLASIKTYSIYLCLFGWARKIFIRAISFVKTRAAILIAYLLISISFIIWMIPLLIKATKEPFIPLGIGYSELMSSTVSLSTITLAIFFAVIVAIIQNVSRDFSGAFLKTVITDSIFISSVLIILTLNIGFLTILRYGGNEPIVTAIYVSACYIIGTFFILSWLTYHYLNITNIIKTTIIRTTKFIRKNIPKASPPLEDTVLLAKITKLQKTHLWVAKWIYGAINVKRILELGVAKREVENDSIEKIEIKLRPIGSALISALDRDREDVFVECLTGFEASAITYIEARKNYIGGVDSFNIFLLSQYDSALKGVLSSPNQHYSEAIASSAGRIGTAFLDLKTITVWGSTNDHIGVWTGYLKKIGMYTYELEYTAAPLTAVDNISRIAQRLILKKIYDTAIYIANRDIEQLGIFLARSNKYYASVVAGRCISGIINEMYALLRLSSTGEALDDIYVRSIAESIEKIVSESIDIKSSRDNYDALISPLFSVLWAPLYSPNIATMIENTLNLSYKNTQAETHTILLLTAIVEKLGSIARYTYQRETTQAGWFTAQSFSEIVYHVLNYYYEKGRVEERNKDASQELLKEAISGISNAMTFAIKNTNSRSMLEKYSAVPALIIYFALKHGLSELIDSYRIVIDGLIGCYNEIKGGEDPYWHRRKRIREYIQLFGAWLHLAFPASDLSGTVKEFLRGNRIEDEVRAVFTRGVIPELTRLGYPAGELFSESWYLYPSAHWQTIQTEVTSLLSNLDNYRAYHSLVSEPAL